MNLLKGRQNYLFVIGIDEYMDSNHVKLNNCVYDCKNLVSILTSQYSFNLIGELYNSNATKINIIGDLIGLTASMLDEDNLVIYFAGHGAFNRQTQKGYWIPFDAEYNASYYIPNAQIKDILEDVNVKHLFLISDSCFSGSFLTKTRGNVIDLKHYSKLDENKSRFYLSSGRSEVVLDGRANTGSIFANSLIKVLDENVSQYISTSEIVNYVSKAVGAQTNQQPIAGPINIEGNEFGQMIFIKNVLEKAQEDVISAPTIEELPKLIRTYGYFLGQNRRLNLIGNKYPDLKHLIEIAKMTWNGVFGKSVAQIEDKLKNVLGSEWESYRQKLTNQFDEYLDQLKIQRANSLDFIEEVKLRAKVIDDNIVMQSLLVNKPEFQENPALEFVNNFKQTISTKGIEKAKGLEISLEIPLSWEINVGKRPNVIWLIQDFQKEIGLTIVIQKLNLENVGTDIHFDSLDENIVYDMLANKEMVINDKSFKLASDIEVSKTKIDGCLMGILVYEGMMSRNEMQLDFFRVVYNVSYNDYLITIQFMVKKLNGQLPRKVKFYKNYFSLIINSLIIVSKYK